MTFKKGDVVTVHPIDGPMPGGIPYQGYKTVVTEVLSNPALIMVKATNGFDNAVVFIKELKSIVKGQNYE
jgi:hypothetical protein